jgi:hypothetical protein
MPLLFLKLCAPKEAMRGAAEAALQGARPFSRGARGLRARLAPQHVPPAPYPLPSRPAPSVAPILAPPPFVACALQFTADDLLPALNRSLDAMKQPAAKVCLLHPPSTAHTAFWASALALRCFPTSPGPPTLTPGPTPCRQPQHQVSVMEFCVLFIGEGKVAGVPLASMHLRWGAGVGVGAGLTHGGRGSKGPAATATRA